MWRFMLIADGTVDQRNRDGEAEETSTVEIVDCSQMGREAYVTYIKSFLLHIQTTSLLLSLRRGTIDPVTRPPEFISYHMDPSHIIPSISISPSPHLLTFSISRSPHRPQKTSPDHVDLSQQSTTTVNQQSQAGHALDMLLLSVLPSQ